MFAYSSLSSLMTFNIIFKIMNLMIFFIFNLRVFTFGFDTEKALFRVILGLLLLSISVCRLREMGCVSKNVYVRVVHDLELLRYVLRCAIERQL